MESLHYLLMKTHTMLNRKILSQAGQHGLTAGQPKVLEFLAHQGEADQRTIASYCEIEPATVGSILLRMERAGLVMRRQKEGNRRSLFVSLTPMGEQAAETAERIFQQEEEWAQATLTPDELEQLKGLLDKLWKNMEENETGGEERRNTK